MKRVAKWYLPIYFLLNSLALLWAGLTNLAVNAESNSGLRQMLTVGIFALSIITLGIAIWLIRKTDRREIIDLQIRKTLQLSKLNFAFGISFAVFWGLIWLPPEKTGQFFYYFTGLYPLIVWLTFVSGLTLLLSLILRDDFSIYNGLTYWKNRKTLLWGTVISLLIFVTLAATLSALKPWEKNEPYWYGAGVPLLIWQVYIVAFIAILAKKLSPRMPKNADVFIFFVIWAISAFFWARQPLQSSFFYTPPMFPNHEFYPFADLETFDRASQYALIGQGINNGDFFDRALYISFLIYLHTIAGQNVEQLMAIQSAIFAIFPAVVYLIGKHMHSRSAGLIASVLTAWRGINALAAMAWIDTSTSKHMLTDFPTAIGVSIFCLFLILWLKDPQKQWTKAAWAAGTLGLTSLLRPHVMALLIVFLPVIFICYLPRWRKGIVISMLAVTAMLAAVSPWTFLGMDNISVIDLYRARILNVIRERYVPDEKPIPFVPGKAGLLLNITKSPDHEIATPFQLSHFLNNIQNSAFTLPVSAYFLSVRDTVKSGETIWKSNWDGILSPHAAFLLGLGLALTALGLGAGLQKNISIGLTPFVIFIIYHLANGLSRTSGGRYLVPVDWIVIMYYGLGLGVFLDALSAFFNKIQTQPEPTVFKKGKQNHWLTKTFAIIACFSLLGGSIPLSEYLHPLRYTPKSKAELIQELVKYMPQAGIAETDIKKFIQEDETIIIDGYALYPRFFAQGAGMTNWEPFAKVEYPRTVFMIIGPKPGRNYVRIAGPSLGYFPNANDVVIVGCKHPDNTFNVFDALLVILPKENIVYKMLPTRPLQCPIQEPICDNNKNCE